MKLFFKIWLFKQAEKIGLASILMITSISIQSQTIAVNGTGWLLDLIGETTEASNSFTGTYESASD